MNLREERSPGLGRTRLVPSVLAALSWRLTRGALRAGLRVKAHRVVMPMAVSPDRRGGTG